MSQTRRQQRTPETQSSGAPDHSGRVAPSRGGVGEAARRDRFEEQAVGDHGPDLHAFGQAVETEASSGEWEQVLAGNRLLQQGARGAAVEVLQQQLRDRGHRVLVDGNYGPGTERAVRAVQRELGLSVDGVVGGGTARALAGRPAQLARGDRGGDRGHDTGPGAATTFEDVRVTASTFERQGLRPRVFELALNAFETAWNGGETERLLFTVIDYELPSSEKRMWVIDLGTGRLLFHEHVTHGSGSDRNHDGRADRMSNVEGSNASNVGLLRTDDTYHGRHGESLRLDGLERGFNHNARERAIVMHSASYATDAYRERHGKLGRSHGCPALDPDVSGDVIRTIRGGTLLFGYYPDPQWLERSRYLSP